MRGLTCDLARGAGLGSTVHQPRRWRTGPPRAHTAPMASQPAAPHLSRRRRFIMRLRHCGPPSEEN